MRECSKISFPSGSHLKIARKVGDLNSSDSSVVCHAPLVAEEKPMQQLATFPFVKREFEDISSKYKRAPAEVKVGEALPRAANISTADYCTRKYETLLELENTYSVSGYLENIECGLVKPQILAKHRSILMDWMVDVVHSFRLNMETLFYSMRIVDQYMTHVTVKTSGLQLVAVAAMHVICRYTDNSYDPKCGDLVALAHMTDNSYSPSVINNMASDIIAVLQPVCSVMAPTPLTFIRALPQAMQLDDPFNQYMLFVAESCLMYLSVVNKYKPSQVAGVAMVVAQRSLALGPSPVPVSVDEIHAEKTSYKQHRQYKPWDAKEVLLYTRYSVLELKPCIEHVQVLLDTKHPEHEELYQVKAVARKYGRNLRDMSLYPLNFDVPFPTETLTTPLRVEERLSISSMDME